MSNPFVLKDIRLKTLLFCVKIVILSMDSRAMSFREIKNAEQASTSGSDPVNSLESMFSLNRSQSINHADIEEVETNPQEAWKLPSIEPSKVYQDLSMFYLKAITRVFVKKSISTIQQNSYTT